MKVQVQISIYSLKTSSLSGPVYEFCRILKDKNLEVQTRTMDSLIKGESDIIFKALQEAFGLIAEKYNVVMDFKISNVCPKEAKKKVKKG